MSGGSLGLGLQGEMGNQGSKRNPYPMLPTSTGFSSARMGRVRIDPSIRAIQEQSLSKNNNLYNALGSQAESLLGNQSAYINARVNPLEREYDMRQGQVERSIGLRGLAGSSFGDQALTGLANEKQMALGDARSLATQESLAELGRVRAQQFASAGIDSQVAKDRFMQELYALNLGEDQIKLASGEYDNYQKRMLERNPTGMITYGSGPTAPSMGGKS